ncbi:MAG: aminotransferase class I/II-fold pyridoxal phosphate-dependent enzyme [Candidatus Lokiarchaeota archaeon]|nr:aminotransferase class I/II-fold pyridoxal phosphate-dependent enzyme [Candidatus Lokiarchaeota archaeon]MBD3337666.1 aminotransferase class I/II-fold pyridoxal phosphate-dependent enzyme [Candidatus Lokiarchaeota archaeon]
MNLKEFKLETYFAQYEFNSKYLLCASDCESFTVDELFTLENGSEEEFRTLYLGYTESHGHPILRREISKLYKTGNSDNILVFSGAEEAIFIFMNILLDKGDHIIAQFPAYQSLYEVANGIGCDISKWVMNESLNWDLDIAFLENSIRPTTKAIVLNYPHNPTGALLTKKKFQEIIEIAQKYDIFIFSDEVYRFLEYDQKYQLPAIYDVYEKSLSLGVMSKTFGLAGLRIGWIATHDRDLYEKIAKFKHYTTICNSAPSEALAIIALKNKNLIIKRNLDLIKNNLSYLDDFFNRFQQLFHWVRPKAGCVAFPLIKFDRDAERFCKDLLDKKSVLLLPSTMFNYDINHFRIGFGRKDFQKGLKELEDYIKKEL